jgi:hypothetical protein
MDKVSDLMDAEISAAQMKMTEIVKLVCYFFQDKRCGKDSEFFKYYKSWLETKKFTLFSFQDKIVSC